MHKTACTYFNGDSSPFSAIALMALSNGSCTFAHAKSNSIRLCAHFEAINSNPELFMRVQEKYIPILLMFFGA